ncbi:hypothetical protein C7M84_013685 [Penaeus vannamei]|uniref:Uncharacterized protein n=1 Tax=Penaeus vannamei TaxID=6689 RepID=A0A3R7MTF0_PENVA|nr:hypothetical protein C7M84_013685 [Penaeus vannamei]
MCKGDKSCFPDTFFSVGLGRSVPSCHRPIYLPGTRSSVFFFIFLCLLFCFCFCFLCSFFSFGYFLFRHLCVTVFSLFIFSFFDLSSPSSFLIPLLSLSLSSFLSLSRFFLLLFLLLFHLRSSYSLPSFPLLSFLRPFLSSTPRPLSFPHPPPFLIPFALLPSPSSFPPSILTLTSLVFFSPHLSLLLTLPPLLLIFSLIPPILLFPSLSSDLHFLIFPSASSFFLLYSVSSSSALTPHLSLSSLSSLRLSSSFLIPIPPPLRPHSSLLPVLPPSPSLSSSPFTHDLAAATHPFCPRKVDSRPPLSPVPSFPLSALPSLILLSHLPSPFLSLPLLLLPFPLFPLAVSFISSFYTFSFPLFFFPFLPSALPPPLQNPPALQCPPSFPPPLHLTTFPPLPAPLTTLASLFHRPTSLFPFFPRHRFLPFPHRLPPSHRHLLPSSSLLSPHRTRPSRLSPLPPFPSPPFPPSLPQQETHRSARRWLRDTRRKPRGNSNFPHPDPIATSKEIREKEGTKRQRASMRSSWQDPTSSDLVRHSDL